MTPVNSAVILFFFFFGHFRGQPETWMYNKNIYIMHIGAAETQEEE